MAAPADRFRIAEIVTFLKARLGDFRPDVAIVCGSGLSGLSKNIRNPVVVKYSDIPFFPQATVAGHGTELVFGELGGKRVVAQRGRFHMYEGYEMAKVAVPVRVFAALGARVLVVTNAAGGVNPTFSVGDIMVIRDHISLPCLGGAHPLIGANDERFGPRFPPMTMAYPSELQSAVQEAAEVCGLTRYMRAGVYFHDSGPTYETPAEIGMMRRLGGDAVGMSTVPEVIAAAHAGMAVVGLSLITNQCRAPGDVGVPPSHEEVLAATDARATDMQRLVAELVARVELTRYAQPPAVAAFDAAPAAAPAATEGEKKACCKGSAPGAAAAGAKCPCGPSCSCSKGGKSGSCGCGASCDCSFSPAAGGGAAPSLFAVAAAAAAVGAAAALVAVKVLRSL